MSIPPIRELSPIAFLPLLAFLPLFVTNLYTLHIIVIALLAVIPAMGLQLILTSGHLSLGQAVFLGVGAYGSVFLVGGAGLSFWLALPLAGLLSGAAAAVIGWPALRLKGAYFAMLTFGLGEAVRLILMNCPTLSGGASGIPGGESAIKSIPHPDPINIPFGPQIVFDSKQSFFYLALILVIVSAAVMHRIQTSRTGQIIKAIEQSDSLARSLGVNVTSYKLNAFVTACFFTGVSGAAMAHYMQSVTPKDFTYAQSADIALYTIIGGRKSVTGPIIGAMGMVFLSNSFSFLEEYQTIIYGATAIAVLMLLPDGIASLPETAMANLRLTRGSATT